VIPSYTAAADHPVSLTLIVRASLLITAIATFFQPAEAVLSVNATREYLYLLAILQQLLIKYLFNCSRLGVLSLLLLPVHTICVRLDFFIYHILLYYYYTFLVINYVYSGGFKSVICVHHNDYT